ncbi:MAG: carboxypeptidase-like regulatory domain-containing protein [Steroidobacteraceae bacterium]
MNSFFSRAAILAVGLLALGDASHAQGTLGSLTARLVDPNGAVITNLESVVITMTNKATSEVRSVPLPASGEFTIAGLAAGAYDLVVPIAQPMFQPYEQQGVTITAGKETKLDLPVAWGMNLGTIGDDPVQLANDMRATAGEVKGPTPRMPDGKVDFSGFWANIPMARGQGRRLPPMQPWAAEMNQQLQKLNTQNPGAYCLPQDAVPIVGFPYRVYQARDALISITEFVTPGWRQVFMDGRPHPPADEWNPAWLGHSTGKWEGDTLVIDSVGFNEIAPGFGVHSEKLHVVERWRRPDRGRLEIEITATDPDAWTGEYKANYAASLIPNQEVLEFICAENNQDVNHWNTDRAWRGRP